MSNSRFDKNSKVQCGMDESQLKEIKPVNIVIDYVYVTLYELLKATDILNNTPRNERKRIWLGLSE